MISKMAVLLFAAFSLWRAYSIGVQAGRYRELEQAILERQMERGQRK